MKIPFKNENSNPGIIKAKFWVGEFLKSEEFLKLLVGDWRFSLTSVKSGELMGILQTANARVGTIRVTQSWYFNRRVRAWVKASEPNTIYFNSRNANNCVASLAGTICHELMHIYDNHTDRYLGHGDNSPRGKEKTVPYWAGSECQKYVNKSLEICTPKPEIRKKSWWRF